MRAGRMICAMCLHLGIIQCVNAADHPSFEIHNPTEFAKLASADAHLEKLAGGMKFLEGPVWFKDGYLIFSDISANQLKKWDAKNGVTIFRDPSRAANGNTLDDQGRLITCEQNIRGVTRTEKDGTVTTLVDHFDGKRFNSPNDVIVKSDHSIWFTDPPYGLPKGQKRELDHQSVYCFDPETKKIAAVITDMDMPNGLCFSREEKQIYVGDSGKARWIRVYDIGSDGEILHGRLFAKIDKGVPDGMRIDQDGRLWSSAGDGVQIFASDGSLIGKIVVPETPANLCFGGEDGHTLFICARSSLYRINVKVGPAH